MRRGLMLAALAALSLSALSLGACTTATPFEPATKANAGYGYSERRIEDDRFTVTFAGNSVTSRQTVESYMLYRSAQLTVNSGYDWFETIERHTQGNTQVVGAYDPWWGAYGPYWRPTWRAYGRRGWGAWGPGWGPDWDVSTITRYEASTDIVMHHGAKPADNPRALDAHQVLTNLGPHILLPGAEKKSAG
jgi:hypothetical protein